MKSRILSGTVLTLSIIAILHSTVRAQQPSRSVWDGVYSEEQLKRGTSAYAQECAMCHGIDLNGGEEAPALTGAGFLANWTGLTVGDLSERIRVSMPPDNPGRVSRQQNVDIIAFLLNSNRFPVGKTDLVTQPEMLKLIKIDEMKP